MFITQLEEFHPPLVNCVGDCLNGQRKTSAGLLPEDCACLQRRKDMFNLLVLCTEDIFKKNIHLFSQPKMEPVKD